MTAIVSMLVLLTCNDLHFTMSADEMVELCEQYMRKYHLRPRYLLMKLMQAIRSPGDGVRSIKSGWTMIKRISRNRKVKNEV